MGVWDIEVESQDSPAGIEGIEGVGACVVAASAFCRACASQASRVLWSTGQASASEGSGFGCMDCGGCEGGGEVEPSRLFALPIVAIGKLYSRRN